MTEQENRARYIIEFVTNYFGVSSESVFGKSRTSRVVRARHIIFYLLKHKLLMTLVEIGKFLSKDHSTVLHGVASIRNCIECQDYVYLDVQKIIRHLELADMVQTNRVVIQLPKDVNMTQFISDITRDYQITYTFIS